MFVRKVGWYNSLSTDMTVIDEVRRDPKQIPAYFNVACSSTKDLSGLFMH